MTVRPDEPLVTKPCSRPAASRSAVVDELIIGIWMERERLEPPVV